MQGAHVFDELGYSRSEEGALRPRYVSLKNNQKTLVRLVVVQTQEKDSKNKWTGGGTGELPSKLNCFTNIVCLSLGSKKRRIPLRTLRPHIRAT